MKRLLKATVLGLLCLAGHWTGAQNISIDRGIRAEGLWCFPLVTDSLQYLYLPDRSALALDEKKQPQFSFIRYVNAIANNGDSSHSSISQAHGGGILHFLVSYDTDEQKVKAAQRKLRELLNNDEVRLRGPVVFKEGRFALVSSILNSTNGLTEKKVLAVGEAPVLEGSRIALSFEMDPQRSKLLLESFKTATPDVSLVFDLSFSGLTDAYDAKLTVDWTEVQKYDKISGGVNVYFVSADLEKIYEELRRTSAIKLETAGSDDKLEPLLNNVYNKLTDLLFKRVEPELSAPPTQNALTGIINGLFGAGGSGGTKLSPFSVHAGYKVKDIKTSGSSVLYFNSRVASDRHHFITFNIGDIYKKFGSDQTVFKTVSLDDPDFQQRDVYVSVDGAILPEFDKLINSVTVTLKKQHENGNTTLHQVNISKDVLNASKPLALTYGAVGDSNRVAWLNYEYQAQFQFKGGRSYLLPWQQQNAAMINVFAPYERKMIQCEGDMGFLKSKNVRAVVVQIDYPFFGETRKLEKSIRPEDTQIKPFDVTLPSSDFKYRYAIRWILKNGKQAEAKGENDTEILFIDNLPESCCLD
jgi:hypothetical protein